MNPKILSQSTRLFFFIKKLDIFLVQGDQSYCPPPLKIHDPAYVAQNHWCLVKTQLIEKKLPKLKWIVQFPNEMSRF